MSGLTADGAVLAVGGVFGGDMIDFAEDTLFVSVSTDRPWLAKLDWDFSPLPSTGESVPSKSRPSLRVKDYYD